MSDTTSTAATPSGVPVLALPSAASIASTDKLWGIVNGKAQLVSPDLLAPGLAGFTDDASGYATAAKASADEAAQSVVALEPVYTPVTANGTASLAFQSTISTTYDVTLSANSTITIADGAVAGKPLKMEVRIIPNGFLATVVFQGSAVWQGGGAPIFSMNQASRFFLSTTDGGATCYGSPN